MQSKPASTLKAIRVMVADSSRIHTELLSEALKRDPELEIVSWTAHPQGLLAAALAADVNVLAVSSALDGQPGSGLETLRGLRSTRPAVRTVVLLDSQKPETILDAFRAGARGVFNRDSSIEMFCKCIRSVHQGQIWADSSDVALVIEALAAAPRMPKGEGLSLLSKREAEVVQCLVQGLSNREIAERMGLSQHTVKNYLFRVFDKLGVSSRTELLFMTLSQGLASEDASSGDSAVTAPDASHSNASLASLRKAAEAGSTSAQLSLSEAYLANHSKPEDQVQAYMWYLVATERAAEAKPLITKRMTPRQIADAEQQASTWLSRLKKVSPFS